MSGKKFLKSRIVAVGLAITLSGCGYGEVSPRGYQYATALYTICNQKQESRLESFVQLVDDDLQQGQITEAEADWLRGIVDQARNGDWESANAAARALLEDQVEGR